MVTDIRRAAAALALALCAIWPNASSAQTATRTASFAYDAGGQLIQEVIEPAIPALALETNYVRDTFGNKISNTVSGIDIASRTTATAFDARGQFVVSNTNALSQSESLQFDPRFGTPSSQTGPNGLTTTWTYDSLGRKTLEVRPDGTQTQWAYQFCSGVNGGTATCPTGAAYLVQATPLASDGATQNGPIGTVYYDPLNREIAGDTQGFDGSTIVVSKQYDTLGRLQQQSRPYFAASGTPQWTTYTYDAIDRIIIATFPDGHTKQLAYHGLVTGKTNALNQTRTTTRNSQGQIVSVTDAAGNTTSYAYDPFGNLNQITDPLGNVIASTYDVRGRKTASADPDLGAWTYSYDTASELVSQTDAKSQTSTFNHDLLGRLTQRVEPDMTSAWTYDAAPNGIGKLALASVTAGPSAGYARQFSYDSLSRPNQVAIAIDGATYTFAATYDANSRLSTVTYPSGFSLNYTYTNLGDAQQLAGGGTVYWTANARDAEMHLTQATAGNGVVTSQSYDPQTGRLIAEIAGSNNAVESFGYTYDALGNPLTRSDSNESLTETLTYDNLNRLTSATVSQNVAPVKTFSYDPVGDLLTKSDVGTYTYPSPGSPQPHAVTSIAGSAINTTFTYDPNGNETTGFGRSITYASYNEPSAITQGSSTLFFNDDMDHQRYKQIAPEGNTLYFNVFGLNTELFISATSQWNEYLSFSDAVIGVRFETASETITTRYFHSDHLGSIAVITDEGGNVVERDSYDAWGKRRFATGADDPTGSITSLTTRGFTDQEELAVVGLVDLNARVYDPQLGKFTSVDPFIGNWRDSQTLNAYSYGRNNPLVYKDPSGSDLETGVDSDGDDDDGSASDNSGLGIQVAVNQLPMVTVCPDPGCPAEPDVTMQPDQPGNGGLGSPTSNGGNGGSTSNSPNGGRSSSSNSPGVGHVGTDSPAVGQGSGGSSGQGGATGQDLATNTGASAFIYVNPPSVSAAEVVEAVAPWAMPFYGYDPVMADREARTLADPNAQPGKIGPGFMPPDFERMVAAGVDVGTWFPLLKAGVAGLKGGLAIFKAVGGLYPKIAARAATRGGVYALRDSEGVVMRTGMTNNLVRRAGEHSRDPAYEGLEFHILYESDVYAERRGLEQIAHDTYNPPLNVNNPIDPRNKKMDRYMNAARDYLKRTGQ
jgi:RHS repeat-associated protein